MPFSCKDSTVRSDIAGWGVHSCHTVLLPGVGVVNSGILFVLVPPPLYRCRHDPCVRRVERFGSWSCRGNDETSNTNNNLRTHRCWLLVVLAECDGKGRNNATLRCKRMALARNCQRLLRGLDSSKTPLSNVGQVSGGGRCSIWHTWGTRWADMLLHPHQTRPKNRARYPHPLDRPVSTATCRAYFFYCRQQASLFLA